MKELRVRITTIFKISSINEKLDILKHILSINKIINDFDNDKSIEISCEIAQMKNNSIKKFKRERLEENQDGSQFLIFKN